MLVSIRQQVSTESAGQEGGAIHELIRKFVAEDSIGEFAGGSVACGDRRVELVAQGHKIMDPRDDAVLFG